MTVVSVEGRIDANFCAHAVADIDATGSDTTGTSIQRLGDGDTNSKADWTDQNIATFGALNQGQVPF